MLHHLYGIILRFILPQCITNEDEHGFTILHLQPRKCQLGFSTTKNIPHSFYFKYLAKVIYF